MELINEPKKFTNQFSKRPNLVPPSLDIRINDNKAALNGASFLYIDRWSSASTWGGEQPPRE